MPVINWGSLFLIILLIIGFLYFFRRVVGLNKFPFLVGNIVLSLLWVFQGAKFFWLAISELGLTKYFSDQIWIASQFSVIFVPPICLTYYLWFRR